MASIYLSRSIELLEEECEVATELAIREFNKTYKKLISLVPLLQTEINKYYPAVIIEPSGFEPTLVFCENWDDGAWSANYMFDISCKSPDGNPDRDYSFTQYDIWTETGEPMYKDIFEPLYKCDWSVFKSEDVQIQFDAINCVVNYSGNGYHFYNNHAWL